MKTPLAIVAMLLCCTGVAAQTAKPYDFSTLNLSSINANSLQRKIDSLARTSGLDSLVKLQALKRARTHTPKYSAIAMGYGYYRADYNELSQELINAGLSQVGEDLHGFTITAELRGKRITYAYSTAFLPQQEISGSAYDVRVRGATMDHLFGYDLANKPRLNISPNVGFSYNQVSIQTEWGGGQTNIRSLTDLLTANGKSTVSQSKLDALVGFSVDYHIKYTPASRGIILGLRFGTGIPLIEGKFKYRGQSVDYSPSMRINDIYAAVLVKSYLKAPQGLLNQRKVRR